MSLITVKLDNFMPYVRRILWGRRIRQEIENLEARRATEQTELDVARSEAASANVKVEIAQTTVATTQATIDRLRESIGE